MTAQYNLQRFTDAQEGVFQRALKEIKNDRKQSHWMWFIFPQVAGLGFSETTKFYAIKDRAEAGLYMQHPVLGSRLIEISQALLVIEGKTANQIFGSPDANPVFESVIKKYYNGTKDSRTLGIVNG